MTALFINMLYNFGSHVTRLFFGANMGYVRSGGLITFVSVVFGLALFVYILGVLCRGRR